MAIENQEILIIRTFLVDSKVFILYRFDCIATYVHLYVCINDIIFSTIYTIEKLEQQNYTVYCNTEISSSAISKVAVATVTCKVCSKIHSMCIH